MRKALLIAVCAVVLAALAGPALAQDKFPSKPLTYIISFNPGGESDITARMQEKALEKALGTSVVVTHKPGGGGAVAWSDFQRTARPDGHQIIGVNIPHIIGQPLQRKDAGYATDGFSLITWFHYTPNVILVPREGKFKTLKEFIEFAKNNPKGATVGGSGTYSANHLDILLLEKLAGIKLGYVPYTGTGPIIPAILGGHLHAAMSYSMVALQYKEKLMPLAVAAEQRLESLPDTPTFKECGYDLIGGAYRGVAAPKGTPKAVMDKLAQAFNQVTKEIKPKQEELGFIVTFMTPEQSTALLEKLGKSYGEIFKALAAEKKK